MKRQYTFRFMPSEFVTYSGSSISGQDNPSGKNETNTNACTIGIINKTGTDDYGYWKFDCSSLPEDITVTNVTCTVKAKIVNRTGSMRYAQLFSGVGDEYAKGTYASFDTGTAPFEIPDCGTWTREELQDCHIRIKVYAYQGLNGFSFSFYGASLYVTFEMDDGEPERDDNGASLTYLSEFLSGTYSSISNQNNPVNRSEYTTSYARLTIPTGSGEECSGFWKFDTSSIPADAINIRLKWFARCQVNSTSRLSGATAGLFSDTDTAKGTQTSIMSTAMNIYEIDGGVWKRKEADSVILGLKCKRNTTSTSTSTTMTLYGATLIAYYDYATAYIKDGTQWKTLKSMFNKINGEWIEESDITPPFTDGRILLI